MVLESPETHRISQILLVPHDPTWASRFQAEAKRLRTALGDQVVAIHHAGSTAIPGIRAKPVIDILLVVKEIAKLDERNPQMIQLGYQPRGENGIPGRRHFSKAQQSKRTHNIHAFASGHPEIQRMLDLRDYLRAHPAAAQDYSRLKEELAQAYPEDIENYTQGKSDFIETTLRKARAWRALLAGGGR